LIITDTLNRNIDSTFVVEVPDFIKREIIKSDSITFDFPSYKVNEFVSIYPSITSDVFFAGKTRKKDIMQESIIVLLLLLVVFFLFKFFSRGTETAVLYFRKLSKNDVRSIKTDFSGLRILPVFWVADMIILSFSAKMYFDYYNKYFYSDISEISFYRILFYVIIFWFLKTIVSYIIGFVFFNKPQRNNWFSMSMLIMTFFSLTLLPLIIVNTAGIILPLIVLIIWPLAFLVLPKMFQFLQAPKLFSLKMRGFLFLILYLCALEILPFLVFIKGMILI